MEAEKQKFDPLISGYLSGKLDDKEVKTLTDFLKEDESNVKYFDRFKRNWTPPEDERVSRSWRNMSSKVQRLENLEKSFTRQRIFPQYILKVAAVLAVGLFVGSIVSALFISGLNNEKGSLTFTAPPGEKSIITLSDSSKVWLNSGSKLTLNRNYGLLNREITLDGEAYFEVNKNTLLPFRVYVNELEVKVVGTKFNVSAYADQNTIQTAIKEGLVQVSPRGNQNFKKFYLKMNEMAELDKATSEVRFSTIDIETIIAWKNNQLIIDNENYKQVFKKLEKWYGVTFAVEGNFEHEPNYTMTIKTESLHEIMDLMHLISPIKYKIHGDSVTVSYKKNR